jgi:hypothetical protein
MRQKYCDQESVFAHIWQHADADGLWSSDDASLAEAFRVSEDESYEILGELCDRNRIQRVGTATYIVTNWRDRDDADEEDEQ